MAKRGVGRSPGYIPGDHWAVCDSCGFQFRSSQLRETWDHRWVCSDDWEPRHPQDFLRVRAETQDVDQPIRRDDTSNTGVAAPFVVKDSIEFVEVSSNTTNTVSLGFINLVNNGSVCWIMAAGGNLIGQLTLSSPYDLTSSGTTVTYKSLLGMASCRGMEISSDGRFLWVADGFSNSIRFIFLPTPYDVTTSSGSPLSTVFDPNEITTIYDVKTNLDDSLLFLMDNTYTIRQYSMLTPGDIQDASYDSISFTPQNMPEDASVQSFSFSQEGDLLLFFGIGTIDGIITYRAQIYSINNFSIEAPVLLYTFDYDIDEELPRSLTIRKNEDVIETIGVNTFGGTYKLIKHKVVPYTPPAEITDPLDFTPIASDPATFIPSGTNNNDL